MELDLSKLKDALEFVPGIIFLGLWLFSSDKVKAYRVAHKAKVIVDSFNKHPMSIRCPHCLNEIRKISKDVSINNPYVSVESSIQAPKED